MLVDLLHVTTRDGVRLDGMLQTSTKPTSLIDAVICVHGTGSNFYGSTLFDTLASRLLEMGIAVLRINTRGHDLMCTAATSRGGRRLGAAYEMLDDCRHDLGAWVELAKHKVGPRVALVGHSSGAVKCLYAQAKENFVEVQGVIAISPPRLSYAWFMQSERAREFRDLFEQAQQLVSIGEPNHLLDVKLPLPFVITAAGYVEKYGPDERYNYLTFIDQLKCRVLVTLGEIEVGNNMAFKDTAQAIVAKNPTATVDVIAGADHFYTGVREGLLMSLERWLQQKTGS